MNLVENSVSGEKQNPNSANFLGLSKLNNTMRTRPDFLVYISTRSSITKKYFRYRAQKALMSIPESNLNINFNAFKNSVKTLFMYRQTKN